MVAHRHAGVVSFRSRVGFREGMSHMRTERIGDTDVRFRRDGTGDAALVFVPGFLDDQHVWDGVIAELRA